MMACDTEWRAVDNNIVEDLVSCCALFIVARYFLRLFLRIFFITLVGVIDSVELIGTTEYVFMDFTVLSLLDIPSNTGALSEL